MKCPECKAWTLVLETRKEYRRRECANGHRFWTVELPNAYEDVRREMMSKAKTKKSQP